jgi:hypothetical protein
MAGSTLEEMGIKVASVTLHVFGDIIALLWYFTCTLCVN